MILPVTMEDSLYLQIHLLITTLSIHLPSVHHQIHLPVTNHSINLLSVHLLTHLPIFNLINLLLTRHRILHQVTNHLINLLLVHHLIRLPVINHRLSVHHSNLIHQQCLVYSFLIRQLLRNHPHHLKMFTDRPAHQPVRLSIHMENL